MNIYSNKSEESAIDYMHMLSSNNRNMLIDMPLRERNNSNTNINHVITNNTSNIIYPTIFTSDITDHFLVGCFVANPKISTESVKIKKQSFLFETCEDLIKQNF